MKKLLYLIPLLFCLKSEAAQQSKYVQIKDGVLQAGTTAGFNVSSGTVQVIYAPTFTSTTSIYATGSARFYGDTVSAGSTNTITTGFIGNTVSSQALIAQPCAASGVVGDSLTLSISSGNWLIGGGAHFLRNTSTFTTGGFYVAYSTFSGDVVTGQTPGINSWEVRNGTFTNVVWVNQSVPGSPYYVSHGTGTYTYFLKTRAQVYTAGTPSFTGQIFAVRQP